MQVRASVRSGIAFAAVAAAAALAGCGGTATTNASSSQTASPKPVATAHPPYVDPSYKPSPTVLVSLAIAPVAGAGLNTERIDQGFENAFMNTSGVELRGMPSQFRRRMNGDRQLVQIVDRICSQRYTPQDLASGVGLKQILSPKELEDLRAALNSCTMVLIPAQFETKPEPQRTIGHALARTYDLASGKLLLQNNYDVTIPEGGDAGMRRAAVDLILAIQDEYATHMLLQGE
jgi:hypothetical protein